MSETSAAIEIHSSSSAVLGVGDKDRFEHIQRVAKMFSESQLVPTVFQKNVPNVVIALEMSQRIGASPLMIMQNLNIIHGKPSFGASFMIATINACGRFTPLRFTYVGTPHSPDWGCFAHAKAKADSAECKGVTVTMAIAEKEGWVKKNGSKWQTMPELMLSYRAATWWTRMFAPELLMGFPTEDEALDVVATPAAPFAPTNEQAPPAVEPTGGKRASKGVAGAKRAEPVAPAATVADPGVIPGSEGMTVTEMAAKLDADKAAMAARAEPSPVQPAATPAIAAEVAPAPAEATPAPATPAAEAPATPVEEVPLSAPAAGPLKRCKVESVVETPARLSGGEIGKVCKIRLTGEFDGMAYFNGPKERAPSANVIIDAKLISKAHGTTTAYILEAFDLVAG